MRIRFNSLLVAGGICVLASSLWAQKISKKEAEALNAINATTTVDDRLKAIESVLTNFKDTQFKPMLLEMAMQLEERKGDYPQLMNYGDRLLDIDKKNAFALVTMAAETARRTREFDLDKDQKIANVNKWAKDGIEAAKSAPKPPGTTLTDDQWEAQKKDFQSQGYEAIAMAAAVNKKYDDAITNFKESVAVAANPDPATWLRLGQAYEDAGKLDDANDAFDKAGSMTGATAQIKTIATNKKAEIAKLKAGGAKPPAAQPPAAQPPAAAQH